MGFVKKTPTYLRGSSDSSKKKQEKEGQFFFTQKDWRRKGLLHKYILVTKEKFVTQKIPKWSFHKKTFDQTFVCKKQL